MSGKHARLSASSAYRWMECPGSVGPGDTVSFLGAQGTFAHDIAAQCLKDSSISPTDFFLKRAVIDGHEVECDMEMVEGIQVYLAAVDDDMHPGDIMWVEMPLLEELQSVHEDLGGTADYVRYRRSTQELLACDLKYGAGIYVEVIDNRQLKLYALGALLKVQRAGFKVKQVRSMVVQPRYEGAKPVREEVFPAVELLDFAADAKEAADRTRLPNPALKAGDHCIPFCPKRRTCPELAKKEKALMSPTFTALAAGPALATALADIPLVKARIKAIEEHAYKLALSGVEIPGWKLVDKVPRRKWKSEGNVIEWAQSQAVDPWAPREVLSPAQLEKKLQAAAPRGKKKEAGAVLEQFVDRVSSGTALVPVADDRPPAQQRVTGAHFEALPATANPINI
jgi:hypothetical protein